MRCAAPEPEGLLRTFFDTVDHQMAVLEWKVDTLVFNLANRNLARLLETPPEELQCRPVEDFVDLGEELERWLRRSPDDPSTEAVFTFECPLRARTPPVWLECRIAPMTEDGKDGTFYSFVAVDITERKNAQEELGEVRDRLYDIIDLGTGGLETATESLRLIIDHIPVMICCFDETGGILFVNRAFEDSVGWSLAEIRGMDLMAACYPDPEDRRRAMDFMGSGRSDWEDFRLRRRNGAFFDTSWTNVQLTRRIRIGIGFDVTARKKAEEAVRRLSRKTLEMLESDRQAMAKELHDSIGASLAAIKFSLEGRVTAMGDPPADGVLPLETIIAHLADTIKESKRISNGLRPLTLDDLGLLPTLQAYARQLTATYPEVAIAQEIELEESDLPDPLKIVLYRVVQEALNNIHKHSGATRAVIRLRCADGWVSLEVEDDGCGFDPDAVFGWDDPLTGYGLRSMRERVEICGGSFRIRTTEGAGTTVVAVLPVG
jgi:PAS domain S-box-containing protein